ncbi:MAG: hypothetical protein KIH69_002625 [Anaerolineae bacterium]|nr:hypothetical protein [Anaerolineae bacterium]
MSFVHLRQALALIVLVSTAHVQPAYAAPPAPNALIAQAEVAPTANRAHAPAAPNDRLIGLDLNEISIQAAPNGFEWVELKNNYWQALDISGYKLSNEEGMWFVFPNLPPVPPETFVLVIFDGLGSATNDTDPSDKRIVLHSPPGMVNVLNDQAGQLSLYGRGTRAFLPLTTHNLSENTADEPSLPWRDAGVPHIAMRDFVAWGTASTDAPGPKAEAAIAAGLWQKDMFVSLDFAGTTVDMQNKTIGRYPGRYLYNFVETDWLVYSSADVTQGSENKNPAPEIISPATGNTLFNIQRPEIFWSPLDLAESYQVQIDDEATFATPVISGTVAGTFYSAVPNSNLNYGRYYARIRAFFSNKTQSAFSPSIVFTLAKTTTLASKLPDDLSSGVIAIPDADLPVSINAPAKDTKSLDLHNLWTNQGTWDAAHAKPENAKDLLLYSQFSVIQAMAKYYGGNLSQDRIAYELCKNYGERELDLCPINLTNRILSWNNGENFRLLLQWALNGTEVQAYKVTADNNYSAEVGAALAKRIPVIILVSDGKKNSSAIVTSKFDDIRWLGVTALARQSQMLTTVSGLVEVRYKVTLLIPKNAPVANAPARRDEDLNSNGVSDLNDDTDGDGVSDFDERVRFQSPFGGLDLANADSDGDLVPDKTEIFAYVKDRRYADIDRDGKRNEVDPDSDRFWDDRSRDGCEDANRNGFYDSQATGNNKETSNADPTQEKDCKNPEITITSPAAGAKIDACLADLQGEIVSVPDMKILTAEIIAAKQQSHVQLSFTKSSDRYTFKQKLPLFKGKNTVLINATNADGGSDQELLVLSCDRAADLHIQLTWGQIGRDVDLHLLRGGAALNSKDDCYYGNANPDWGDAGNPDDNPKLDVDCINNCTVENIYFTSPKPGVYTVIAYYYSDKALGPAVPQVTINARGKAYKLGPRTLAKTGDQWTVATIEVTATDIIVR